MSAWRLYWDLRRRGIRLQIKDDRILAPIGSLTEEEREAVRAHRADLLPLIDGVELADRYVDALRAGAELPPLAGLSREEARRLLRERLAARDQTTGAPGAVGEGA